MSTRRIYLSGFIIVVFLVLFSIYLQIVDGIMPCPLCTLQRFTFVLLACIFFIGLFVANYFRGRILINFFLFLCSAIGIFLSARQIWLQHYGDLSNECGVSLQYMLQVLPFDQVLQKVFAGSAECTQQGWQFLHFNMAEWALLCFTLFFLLSVYLFLRVRRK